MKKICVLMIMLVGLVTAAFSQKPSVVTSNEDGWQKIGEISASFKIQSESIVVLGADKFNEIKLKVTDAPINIERLQVFYESGNMEEFDVLNQLQAGAETRSFALNGNEEIKKVAFTYKTLPNYRGERAHVELYGLKMGQQNKSDMYRDDREQAEKTKNDIEEDAEQIENEIDAAAENTESDIEEGTEKAKRKTKDGVDKVGDKISEAAANAAAEVNDQMYSGKMGPQGQNIYIDKYDKYYYINDEGNKVYISKSQLKDKPRDN